MAYFIVDYFNIEVCGESGGNKWRNDDEVDKFVIYNLKLRRLIFKTHLIFAFVWGL